MRRRVLDGADVSCENDSIQYGEMARCGMLEVEAHWSNHTVSACGAVSHLRKLKDMCWRGGCGT
jgi:hypothetical protein